MHVPAADVVVFSGIPVTLTYFIPETMEVVAGCRVKVPVKTSERIGLVIKIRKAEPGGLKPIHALIDPAPLIPMEIIELLLWCSRYYHAGIGACVAMAFPPDLRKGGLPVYPREQKIIRTGSWQGSVGARQRALLEAIPAQGISLRELKALFPGQGAALAALLKRGFLATQDMEKTSAAPASTPPELSAEQHTAFTQISKALSSGAFSPMVLRGITGSGKTEVYLAAALEVLAHGKSVLYLVPEIALTPQTIARIKARIPGEVAIFHSGMSEKTRALEFLKAAGQKASLVLGTRSAIFAPLKDIGLIIVDEEHDGSYKQSEGVAYHARDLALLRAKNNNAVVILGSATPSLETMQRCAAQGYHLIELNTRFGQAELPKVTLVDMRGSKEIISPQLSQALRETLDKGEQSLLYLNRRGFSAAMVCPACARVLSCEHCTRSLTYHKNRHLAVCHCCGYRQAIPEICPACGCLDMRPVGLGTQRIVEEIEKLLAGVRILQMDSDEVNTPARLEEALGAIRSRSIDIIIGTQMIAKGHDFPELTLVGVIQAEQLLFLPDFRAPERTFQQVVQVAGRAGRTRPNTRVIIQSLMPEHPLLGAICSYDFSSMLNMELQSREAAGFPPFRHMARCVFSCTRENEAEKAAKSACRHIKANGVQVLGPAPAPIARLRGSQRWHVLLTAQRRDFLHHALDCLERQKLPSCVRLKIDVDPYDMF